MRGNRLPVLLANDRTHANQAGLNQLGEGTSRHQRLGCGSQHDGSAEPLPSQQVLILTLVPVTVS